MSLIIPHHARSTARPPSPFATSLFLFFAGGEFELEWVAKRRGGLPIKKQEAIGMKIQKVPRQSNFQKERRGSKSICAWPTHPIRAQIPAVLKRNYKTAGIAPTNARNFNGTFSMCNIYLNSMRTNPESVNSPSVCSERCFFKKSRTSPLFSGSE